MFVLGWLRKINFWANDTNKNVLQKYTDEQALPYISWKASRNASHQEILGWAGASLNKIVAESRRGKYEDYRTGRITVFFFSV